MLSRREAEVIALLAEGASTKHIAAELGISMSTVHVYVTRARAKTGARSRAALVVPEGAELPASLSPAERDVVRALFGGRTYKEIAKCRGTTVSTVSNQVAKVFEKVGVRSRGELAAMMLATVSTRAR
ncbi:hypothetical protein BH09MYX1_BH09MYX1_08360 [soil metagenome]